MYEITVIIIFRQNEIFNKLLAKISGMRNTDQWLPDTMKAFLPYYSEEYVKKQWIDLCNVIQQ